MTKKQLKSPLKISKVEACVLKTMADFSDFIKSDYIIQPVVAKAIITFLMTGAPHRVLRNLIAQRCLVETQTGLKIHFVPNDFESNIFFGEPPDPKMPRNWLLRARHAVHIKALSLDLTQRLPWEKEDD